MNAPRTPAPLIHRDQIAIWDFEDIRLIYDGENEQWHRQQLDVTEDRARCIRTGFVDDFLAYYGLSTQKLIDKLKD